MTRPALRALLFDIDDTLFSTTEFACRARRNSIEAMISLGLDVTAEEALQELDEVIAEFSSNYDKHYDKLLTRLASQTVKGVNRALLVAAGVVAYHDTKFRQLRPYPDVKDALRFLKDRTDLVLGIITEGLEIKQAEKLVRLNLCGYLDPQAIFISDHVGISKPNPKLYRHALDRLSLGPGEAMYVGDNPTNDIAPAREAGLITVRYRGAGKHAARSDGPRPDYEIHTYPELLTILKDDFALW